MWSGSQVPVSRVWLHPSAQRQQPVPPAPLSTKPFGRHWVLDVPPSSVNSGLLQRFLRTMHVTRPVTLCQHDPKLSSVGTGDGTAVGTPVGAAEIVGADVGTDVGTSVGLAVGTSVGGQVSNVGALVGALVGADVGSDVGTYVGSKVGSDVGGVVGTYVGCHVSYVGASEGTSVG